MRTSQLLFNRNYLRNVEFLLSFVKKKNHTHIFCAQMLSKITLNIILYIVRCVCMCYIYQKLNTAPTALYNTGNIFKNTNCNTLIIYGCQNKKQNTCRVRLFISLQQQCHFFCIIKQFILMQIADDIQVQELFKCCIPSEIQKLKHYWYNNSGIFICRI